MGTTISRLLPKHSLLILDLLSVLILISYFYPIPPFHNLKTPILNLLSNIYTNHPERIVYTIGALIAIPYIHGMALWEARIGGETWQFVEAEQTHIRWLRRKEEREQKIKQRMNVRRYKEWKEKEIINAYIRRVVREAELYLEREEKLAQERELRELRKELTENIGGILGSG